MPWWTVLWLCAAKGARPLTQRGNGVSNGSKLRRPKFQNVCRKQSKRIPEQTDVFSSVAELKRINGETALLTNPLRHLRLTLFVLRIETRDVVVAGHERVGHKIKSAEQAGGEKHLTVSSCPHWRRSSTA